MKDFPDQNSFNELEKRLQRYTEQPDDLVWQNIDKALRPQRTPLWLTWLNRMVAVGSIMMFAFLIPSESTDNEASFKVDAKSKVIAESDTLAGFTINENKCKAIPEKDLHQGKKNAERHVPLFSNPKITKNEASVVTPVENNTLSINSFQNTVSERADRPSEYKSVAEISNGMDSISTQSWKTQADSSVQENKSSKESKRIPKRGLTFYAGITPQLSFQQIIPVSNDGIVITEFYNQPIFSKERVGINIDAGVQGYITKRLEYYGGVSLYQQRQTLKYGYQSEKNVSLESTADLSYMVTPENRIRVIDYKMLNLGAGGGVLYNLQGRKLLHKIGAGLSYQHGFKKNTSLEYDNSESRYLFYQVFYRNEVRIGAKISVFVQPTFSHTIYTSEKLNAPFNLKPYRAGLGMGLLYDF